MPVWIYIYRMYLRVCAGPSVRVMVPKSPPGADPPVFPNSGSGSEMQMVIDGPEK